MPPIISPKDADESPENLTHVQGQQGPNRTRATEERRRADEGAAHDWLSQRVGEADAHCRPEWLGWDIDCRLRAGEGQQEAGGSSVGGRVGDGGLSRS